MFLNSGSAKDVNYVVLSRQGGGGACAAVTKKAILVGVWGKESKMSNDKMQNTGECQNLVLRVAKLLMEGGN